eukprot:3623748-Rhodomonas_salina.3
MQRRQQQAQHRIHNQQHRHHHHQHRFLTCRKKKDKEKREAVLYLAYNVPPARLSLSMAVQPGTGQCIASA